MVAIELLGGPLDGQRITVEKADARFLFPALASPVWSSKETEPTAVVPQARLEYLRTKRMNSSGYYVYTYKLP